ncbi:MAG TPA: hypothetical protein VKB79_15475 [Bryobacteraceae bacterium]|nr:hypothetical protein [Bryobacteraceae bacterium]
MIGIFRETQAAPRPDTKSQSPLTRQSMLEQVERIVASPLFRNSKRYTGLLRYAVEQKLESRTDLLKERLLGIEVFGRDADYDTNHDPVVRTSAVEIRKRLAQYYEDPDHSGEIRITLPAGSYTPEFSIADLPAQQTAATGRALRKRSYFLPTAVISSTIVLVVVALIYAKPSSAVDQFWLPVRDAAAPILFGVSGGPRQGPSASNEPPKTLSEMFRTREDYVPFGDVSALVDLAGYMRARGKPYRLQYISAVTFQDLKVGPAVFIGPTARWFEQLATGTRYSVQRDDAVTKTWISDRQNAASRIWSANVDAPAASSADTYALVTRIRIESTRQILVSIAGLSPYATSAAGELLSDPQYLAEYARRAPRDWARRNLQLVIATRRVGTTPGAPRIVADYIW